MRIDLDRKAWAIEPWRSIPGGPAIQGGKENIFLEIVPAADVVGFLGPRAQAMQALYAMCHVETVQGLDSSRELGVSLVEREALYRLMELGPEDDYYRDLITLGFAAIQRGRSEGQFCAQRDKRKKDEAERKDKAAKAKAGR